MTSRTDFDDLDIVVRQRRGHYIASIPQIGLHAVADTIPDAIAGLQTRKRAFLADLEAADALADFPVAKRARSPMPGFLRAIAPFAAKCAIAAALALVVVAVAASALIRDLDRFSHLGGKSFWANVERQLDRAADPNNALSDAKRQKLLADLHVIAERWRPFVHEIEGVFAEPDAK